MIWTSLFGIVTLIGLAWALGFRSTSRLIDAEAAATEAACAIAGFEPVEAAVSDKADAAIVAAHDGRLALVRCFGDKFVVRLLESAAVRVDDCTLHVRLPEPGFGPVRLVLASSVGRWAARL